MPAGSSQREVLNVTPGSLLSARSASPGLALTFV